MILSGATLHLDIYSSTVQEEHYGSLYLTRLARESAIQANNLTV
jgi:hypothetical protein